MKSKDYVFYGVSILSFALIVFSPVIMDSVYAQDAPISSILKTWLEHGENFVNSMAYAAGF